MQIVIDIPDEEYKRLVYIDMFKLRGYIENGTPLPERHGYADGYEDGYAEGYADGYMAMDT